jgi:hypothetical protein
MDGTFFLTTWQKRNWKMCCRMFLSTVKWKNLCTHNVNEKRNPIFCFNFYFIYLRVEWFQNLVQAPIWNCKYLPKNYNKFKGNWICMLFCRTTATTSTHTFDIIYKLCHNKIPGNLKKKNPKKSTFQFDKRWKIATHGIKLYLLDAKWKNCSFDNCFWRILCKK